MGIHGGNMWESNPPGQLFTTCNGFEDRGAHQHPSTPILFIIKLIISFIIYSVVLGLIEYICGYLCNILFGIDMWNYKSQKYHIGKYTCLEYIPIWGLIAIIITNILKPYINKIIKILKFNNNYEI